jgi:NAD(P)-dependent dehydrogenase (short-subunit alcohol dehydrogenase family)
MGKLQGKVAVITGGTGGIGLATAQLFVKEGAYVFITGRRQKELDEAVTSIGSNVTGVQGDVAKLADLDRLYQTVSAGAMKVFAYEKYKTMSEKNGPSDLKRGLAMFIDLSELAGAIGIVLPMAANVAPWLSPIAALGLATVMLLAVLYHLRRHEPPTAPAGLFLPAIFVAVGRFFHWT